MFIVLSAAGKVLFFIALQMSALACMCISWCACEQACGHVYMRASRFAYMCVRMAPDEDNLPQDREDLEWDKDAVSKVLQVKQPMQRGSNKPPPGACQPFVPPLLVLSCLVVNLPCFSFCAHCTQRTVRPQKLHGRVDAGQGSVQQAVQGLRAENLSMLHACLVRCGGGGAMCGAGVESWMVEMDGRRLAQVSPGIARVLGPFIREGKLVVHGGCGVGLRTLHPLLWPEAAHKVGMLANDQMEVWGEWWE